MPDSLTPYEWFAAVLRDDSPSFTQLEQSITEDELWQVGQENGVLALGDYKLSSSGSAETLPDTFKKRLHQHTLNAVATELSQEHELRTALSLLTEAKLPFLLMKGTPLSYTHYPQSYLRTRCDTDILFASKKQAEQAWQHLKEIGYQRPNAVSGEFVSHEFSCYKKSNKSAGFALDVHWKLSNTQRFARSFDFDELFASGTTVTTLGEDIKALGPFHALLLACMHRIAHKPEKMENRLIWLYDIHLLGRQFSEQQWQEFVTMAKAKALCGICLDGLQQTIEIFETVVPKSVIDQLTAGSKYENYSSAMGESRITMELANLKALPGWKERIGLVKETVFPDANYMLKKYNTQHKFLLLYLYIKRAVGGMFKLFR